MYFAISQVGRSQSLPSRISARRGGSESLMSSTVTMEDIDSLLWTISDLLTSTTRWMMPQLLHLAYLGTTLSSSPMTEKTVNWCIGGLGCRLNCGSVQRHVTRCLRPIDISSPPERLPGRGQASPQGRPAFFFAGDGGGTSINTSSIVLLKPRAPLW